MAEPAENFFFTWDPQAPLWANSQGTVRPSDIYVLTHGKAPEKDTTANTLGEGQEKLKVGDMIHLYNPRQRAGTQQLPINQVFVVTKIETQKEKRLAFGRASIRAGIGAINVEMEDRLPEEIEVNITPIKNLKLTQLQSGLIVPIRLSNGEFSYTVPIEEGKNSQVPLFSYMEGEAINTIHRVKASVKALTIIGESLQGTEGLLGWGGKKSRKSKKPKSKKGGKKNKNMRKSSKRSKK